MKKTIAYAMWRKDWLVVAFSDSATDPEEWAEYTGFLRREMTQKKQRAIISPRRGLEAYQRRDLDQIMGPHRERDRRVAVITDSTFVRGFVKAMSLLDPTFRAYSTADLDVAFDYAEVPRTSRPEVKALLEDLCAAVGR